jgi:small-conductance mechanosensitive channel
MFFWQSIETTSGLGGGMLYLLLLFCAASLALEFILPSDRRRVRAAMTLFVVAIVGLLIAPIVPGAPGGVIYLWTRIASLFCMSAAVVTVFGVIVFDIALSSLRLKPPAILCDLILAFAYVAAAFLLMSHVGVNLNWILTTGAIATAAIGFSLQDTLGNVIGGVAIQMERAISVGDWIQVNDHIGVVKEIRWRQTSIRTRTSDTIIIPNSVLMKSSVTVLGRRDKTFSAHQQYVYFNVDYRHPPTQVIAAVNEVLTAEPLTSVAREPVAHCLLMDFKDSYAVYAVRYWLTDLDNDEPTDSLIRSRVFFALKRVGIILAIPAYRTFQTHLDQARDERMATENAQRRMNALTGVEMFKPLNDDERKQLAERLRETPFAHGEIIARQGTESHCLYIVTAGSAEVRLTVDSGNVTRTVATLGPGDFFGEMGLMTGDPRAASVFASTDVQCFRLDKEDFMDVLHRRPEIAEAISQILAERRVGLESAREHLTDEARKLRLKKTQGDLLQRIRNFFTLER